MSLLETPNGGCGCMANRDVGKLRAAIQAYRDRRGLKNKPWCLSAGLAGSTLGNFLRGVNDNITIETLTKLAAVNGDPVGVLTGDIPDKLEQSDIPGDDRQSDVNSSFRVLNEDDVYNLQLMVQRLGNIDHKLDESLDVQRRTAALLQQLVNAMCPTEQPEASHTNNKKSG